MNPFVISAIITGLVTIAYLVGKYQPGFKVVRLPMSPEKMIEQSKKVTKAELRRKMKVICEGKCNHMEECLKLTWDCNKRIANGDINAYTEMQEARDAWHNEVN